MAVLAQPFIWLLRWLLGVLLLLALPIAALVGRRQRRTPRAAGQRKGVLAVGEAERHLAWLFVLADRVGAKPFLVSGTLLGMHRNGALLAHDNDIDLGIFHDDPCLASFLLQMGADPQVVSVCVQRLGWLARRLNPFIPPLPGHAIVWKFRLRTRPGAATIKLDLFVHFPVAGQIAHGTSRSLWLNSPFRLEPIFVKARCYLAPAERAAYLAENYGPDFMRPQTDFESFVDCPNCVNIHTFRAARALVSKWALFTRQQDGPRKRLLGQRVAGFLWFCLTGRLRRPAPPEAVPALFQERLI